MSRKRKKSVPTAPPKQEKKMVIDMKKAELAKAYQVPGFRTGKHLTEKDRPRKKNWKREYERERERERCNHSDPALFSLRLKRSRSR
ncbi:MAG: hypothetical protein IJI20_05610 [Firmicutes bacterium]|nr:hypothetical protein [Bacillota bacterium]